MEGDYRLWPRDPVAPLSMGAQHPATWNQAIGETGLVSGQKPR